MAIVIKAPTPYIKDRTTIFLAGAIDMGQAEDWQSKVSTALKDLDVLILNPRRDEWDPTWEQVRTNRKFAEQVNWEQDGLEAADIVVVVFTKTCKAPITFMELGMHLKKPGLVVCCPPGFYRKGNVDICCERAKVPVYETLEELIEYLKLKLAPKAPKAKCDHTWARVGFSGPYWAYECVKCGEEDYGR